MQRRRKKNNSYDKSQIDYIILIGGATRMPLIVNFVEKYFGKQPITSFNPDESVAIGAALRGETLFNNSPYLDSLNLIDVIPLNIGIMVDIDQKFDVILKRNTYIPCKNKKNYKPFSDYQSKVEINIYEGTSKFAKENTLLGKFILDIIPKKASESNIEISLTIDEHLILHVFAEQIHEGKSKKVSIIRKNQILTSEELELEKKKIEKSKLVIMNEEEKLKYSKIIEKQKDFFSSENINLENEINDFIKLIEDYVNEFKIKENNIHFMMILFRLYNLLIAQKKTTFEVLEEKIEKYMFQISEIDIFYVLNFISKFDLEASFQKDLTLQIASFFSSNGIRYLTDDFNNNKNISSELFQLSEILLDNLFAQNNELKNDQDILELIKFNKQFLRYIKINDISVKIKDLYEKSIFNEKYLNQIIELYQMIVNLIENKDDIEYINNLDILYKLGDNYFFLLYIIDIMNSLNAFIQYIDTSKDNKKYMKKKEFTRKLNELNKSYEESRNVNQEYFEKDYDEETLNNILEIINKKYNEGKEKKELTNFILYIIENYPPITMSKSINEFKKNPNIKILMASYSKSITKKYRTLLNKEKLREKINEIISKMFNENVELEALEEEIVLTDDEGDEEESLMTNYTAGKENNINNINNK